MSENFDETLDRAKSHRHLNRHRGTIKKLIKLTRFNRAELEKLFLVHLKISLVNGGTMNLQAFHELCFTVLGITDDTHTEKIYDLFDPNHTLEISPESFARNLSAMLKGSLYEQINFVWKIYSQNEVITRDNITACFKKAIIKKKGDAGYDAMVKDLVSYLVKKLDRDGDGIVTYGDFHKSVEANPLLLECLGPCLPDPESVAAFLTTISSRPNPVHVLPWDIRKLDKRTDFLIA